MRWTLIAMLLVALSGHAHELDELVKRSGVRGGLVVSVGWGYSKLPGSFGKQYRLHILVQGEARRVELAREVSKAGMDGQIAVKSQIGSTLPYGGNMVNLLIAKGANAPSHAEVLRVLAPKGWALVNGKVIAKSRPKEIDEWTHWMHSASGNAVARDTVVGPPRRLQWIARPLWSRHHNTVPSVTTQVSANGRLFYIVDEAPPAMDGSSPDQWSLVARDAFNGIELWRNPLKEWGWKAWNADFKCRFTVPTQIPKRLVAVNDSVYFTPGFNAPLVELDAATGEVRRTFNDAKLTDEILYVDGKLVVVTAAAPQTPSKADTKGPKKSIAVYDAKTGRQLWKKGGYFGLHSKTGSMQPVSHLDIVAGDDAVFAVDTNALVGLSMKDGRELWRIPRPQVKEHPMRYNIRITDMCTLVYHDGVLLFAQLDPDRKIDWREIRGKVHAFDAHTGKELWQHAGASWGWGHPADVFVIDGLVWFSDYQEQGKPMKLRPKGVKSKTWGRTSRSAFYIGLDPHTGKKKREISTFDAFNNGHHHRCYRNKATERFLMSSYRGVEFMPWAGGKVSLNHWARGVCRLGPFPCNGLIYLNPHPCECYIQSLLKGMIALAPAATKTSSVARGSRLNKGPAFGKASELVVGEGDWPMFRRDAGRSGTMKESIEPQPSKVWEAQLEGELTQAIAAGELVWVAEKEAGRVVCLSAADGNVRWSFHGEGRIDSSPSLHNGQLFFGTADGWVYCLSPTDGKPAWRFRAAPKQRIVGAFGGTESAWPVHGAVLPIGGKLYVTAGRSSFLDGGIASYVLDCKTGRVLSNKTIAASYDVKVGTGHGGKFDPRDGILSDILVEYGGSVYMHQLQLVKGSSTSKLRGPLRATAGFLDDSWFSRTAWFMGSQPYGDYIVFDESMVYGVRDCKGKSADSGFFKAGGGYTLFASSRSAKATKKRGKTHIAPASKWAVKVPVRVIGMALAGDVLVAAGTEDRVLKGDDPWAVYHGKRGGVLLMVAAASGKTWKQVKLPSAPAYDGVSVSRGRIYVSGRLGTLYCFE